MCSSKPDTRAEYNKLPEGDRTRISELAGKKAIQAKQILSDMTCLVHDERPKFLEHVKKLHELFGCPVVMDEKNVSVDYDFLVAKLTGVFRTIECKFSVIILYSVSS